MQDASAATLLDHSSSTATEAGDKNANVVSTHVLVPEEQVLKLKDLSRRTRIAQSEYLREAVDDLLEKYGRGTRS